MQALSGDVGSTSLCLEGDKCWLDLVIYDFAKAWAVGLVGVDLALTSRCLGKEASIFEASPRLPFI